MKSGINWRWAALIAANVLFIGVLSFNRGGMDRVAGSSPKRQPFANSVAQRSEMIQQLKQINAQLKEQNALLRSGSLKVVVSDDK